MNCILEKYQEYFDSINGKLEVRNGFNCPCGFGKQKHYDDFLASICQKCKFKFLEKYHVVLGNYGGECKCWSF